MWYKFSPRQHVKSASFFWTDLLFNAKMSSPHDILLSPNFQKKRRMLFPLAYGSDKSIIDGKMFQSFLGLHSLVIKFFDFSIKGIEKLPQSNQALVFVTANTSQHQLELLLGLGSMYRGTGRLLRIVMKRMVIKVIPLFYLFGHVPDYSQIENNMIKDGHWVFLHTTCSQTSMLIDDEKHNSRYKSTSTAIEDIAGTIRGLGVKVVPSVFVNSNWMFFNPILFLWNLTGLTDAYRSYFQSLQGFPKWLLGHISLILFFIVSSIFIIPIPVQCSMVIGDPLEIQDDESNDQFAFRLKHSIDNLAQQSCPTNMTYTKAIQHRFSKEGFRNSFPKK